MFDGGRYDFVKLKYFMSPYGFGEEATFTDNRALFDARLFLFEFFVKIKNE